MKLPLVSVIITTKNSARTLDSLLKSILEQTYRRIEIVVVDNNSSDQTKQIAKRYTSQVFNHGPERSAQRNFGARMASGRLLLFLDSDMQLSNDVLEQGVDKFLAYQSTKRRLGGVIIPEKSFGEGFWSEAKAWERSLNEGEAYFESARLFDRQIFQEYHGYDEDLTGPEDWDLPQRIAKKYPVERVNTYIHHDEGKQTLLGLFKKKYYYGLSAHKYLSKQQLPLIGPSTVYFLRPGFYKNFFKILTHPVISLGMIVMLIMEMIGGGLGYLVGRFKND